MKHSLLLSATALVTGCAVAPDATVGTTADPITVVTRADATCTLSLARDPSDAITVYADDRGAATFSALHATAGDPDAALTLACHDDTGWTQSYELDRSADATFLPPTNLPAGTVRPALTGDPLSYSSADLLARGYGMRPDPTTDPEHYALWLQAAQQPARKITTPPRDTELTFASNSSSLSWGGGMLRATQDCFIHGACWWTQHFIFSFGVITVPQPTFTTGKLVGEWTGLGGYSNDTLLLQDGIAIQSLFGGAAFVDSGFREYFGAGTGAGYSTAQTIISGVQPDDLVIAQSWACDANGNESLAGGYGCYYLSDISRGMYVECETQSGSCFSLPVQSGTFEGSTAEMVVEKDSNNPSVGMPNFGTITPSLDAYDSTGAKVYFGSAPNQSINLAMAGGPETLVTAAVSSSNDSVAITFEQSNY
ncbi:MAG TPA: hypothetical protein VGG74_03835 [Kofleriaceae bacterium]|jgi:hypothetical protein